MKLRIVYAVAEVTWRAWLNGLERASGSRRAARLALFAVGAALLGWVALGTWQLGSQLRLDADITPHLVIPVAGIIFAFPALATIFAEMYTPERTSISTMLAVLPLRESDREIASRWLVVALGLVFGGVWSAPLTLQFLFTGSLFTGLVAAVACAVIAVCGALTAQVAMSVTELLAVIFFGRRSVLTRGLSGLGAAIGIVVIFVSAMPAQGRDPGGPMRYLGAAIGWSVHGWRDGASEFAVLFCLPGLLIGAAALLERLPTRALEWHSERSAMPRIFPAARTLVGLEIRQWLRYPNNAVNLVVISGISIASLTLWHSTLAGESGVLGFFLILTLIGTLGVGSFGPTRAHHWIFLLLDRPLAWVFPKLVSVFAIWSALAVLYGAILAVTTGWPVSEGVTALPLHLMELAVGCLVGIALPVTREQSLAGSFSESMAIFAVVAVSVTIQQLPWGNNSAGYFASCLGMVVVLVGIYVWTARGHMLRLVGADRGAT